MGRLTPPNVRGLFRFGTALALLVSAVGSGAAELAPRRGAAVSLAALERAASLQRFDAGGAPLREPAWHFTHRAAGLRAYVSSSGVEFLPRRDPDWSVSLVALGPLRGGSVPSSAQSPRAELEAGRVIRRHAWGLEWYESVEAGLEQGFVFSERPPNAGDRLALALRIRTGLQVALEGSSDVMFEDETRERFRLSGLKAFDATGDELSCRFSLDGDLLIIEVEDGSASYPLTIDPLATTPDGEVFGDQSWAQLGSSVAGPGDVDGDGHADLLVGAPLYDGGQLDEGAVFLFRGGPTGLETAPHWRAECDAPGALLGSEVAGAGDVDGDGFPDLLAGAWQYEDPSTDPLVGAAFLWRGGPAALAEPGTKDNALWWTLGDTEGGARGAAVGGAGDVNGDGFADLLVGAPGEGSDIGRGRAYLFVGSPGGPAAAPTWAVGGASLSLSGGLGTSVGAAGDVNLDGYGDVTITDPGYSGPEWREGAVYVWYGGPSVLSGSVSADAADWWVQSDMDAAALGDRATTAGDVNGDGFADLLIGSSSFDLASGGRGKVHLFLGSSTGLPPGPGLTTAAWTAEGRRGQHFGQAVSTAGDVDGDGFDDILVGAWTYGSGEIEEGKAYLWLGGAGGLGPSGTRFNADWSWEPDRDAAWAGWSVASLGDVDGDCGPDVAVGARGVDVPDLFGGAAYLFHGTAADGLVPPTPSWTDECSVFGVLLTCGSPEPGYSYSWDLDVTVDSDGDGDPANDEDGNGCSMRLPGGGRDVRLWARSSGNCRISSDLVVPPSSVPAPPVPVAVAGCQESPVGLDCGVTEAGASYTWDLDPAVDWDGNGVPDDDDEVVGCLHVVFFPAGAHEVRAFATGVSGCTVEVPTLFEVAARPLAPPATVTVTCPGSLIRLDCVREEAGVDYSWDLDVLTDSDGNGSPDDDADVSGCVQFALPTLSGAWVSAHARNAAGCGSSSPPVQVPSVEDERPDDVGASLRVPWHGPAADLAVVARLEWAGDAGLPRPLDQHYHVRRGSSPDRLFPHSALPEPLAASSALDATPSTGRLRHCTYYSVHAADSCERESLD